MTDASNTPPVSGVATTSTDGSKKSDKRSPGSSAASLTTVLTLIAICLLATAVRLFSVIKYESVIHEFDPYFNYRVTRYLTEEGFTKTWNFFDSFTWYPLGRIVGGTMYPGLIFTAGLIWKVLQALRSPIHIQEICVFMGPLFSGLCALATFFFMREVRGDGAGLASAAFIAIIPSYISRSVAGSYDLESIAIAALVTVFFLYVKTLNTASLRWATALFFGYLYMVASWGGYSFIVNLLPIHCLASIVLGRVSTGLYVAYAPFAILGALAALNIPVIGFNAVLMSEHFASFAVFGILHAAFAIKWIKETLPPRTYEAAKRVVWTVGTAVAGVILVLVTGYVTASPTFGWTGRSLSLLDPTYASKYIPIIASVSEHQPPAWSSYYNDLHLVTLLAPAGLVAAFTPLTDASLFLVLYAVTAVYFSGVMVRLMLVLAPAAACLAGLALSEALSYLFRSVRAEGEAVLAASGSAAEASGAASPGVAPPAPAERSAARKAARAAGRARSAPDAGAWMAPGSSARALPRDVAWVALAGLFYALALYVRHSVYIAGEHYSAPSIVLQTRQRDGSIKVFDDFREAYSWLSHNVPADAKVASWWDYGYQTTAMANRTVIVDNNTWNNTHIATVGRAMALPEKASSEVFRSLDVEYVFVVFGAFIGYPSDDINKFLWMVRIGGGVFPDIKERDYLNRGQYRVDSTAPKAMLDSTMYRLSYYRFAETGPLFGMPYGYDRVRQQTIGLPDFKLKHYEEVFTSEHWMVRVYRVLPEPNREVRLPNPNRVKAQRGAKVKPRRPSGDPTSMPSKTRQ
uniref:dolichyl-diphosphooligosaccharide--protein glycotransferase n=1 Tax=Auxenochlorella protothecoides TaxID=3075 RepID=A0A1D2AA71_AUXPR